MGDNTVISEFHTRPQACFNKLLKGERDCRLCHNLIKAVIALLMEHNFRLAEDQHLRVTEAQITCLI